MSLTIKRVPTVVSIHQLDDADDPKANIVSRVCRPGKSLPALLYAPRATVKKTMRKVRSFGSFDDLRVPDLDRDTSDCGSGYGAPSDDGSSDGDTGSTGGGYVQDVSPSIASSSRHGRIDSPRVSSATTSPRARPRWCPADTDSSRSSTRVAPRRSARRSSAWTKCARISTAPSSTSQRRTRRRCSSALKMAPAQ